MDVTMGFVFPPVTTPPSNEFIIQLIAPITNGYTGISLGGQMANSLLFTLWPYDNELILGPRWTSGYVLPEPYPGPETTLLPSSGINSTHIKATFRCQVSTTANDPTRLIARQNCTVWDAGSMGSGDLTSFTVIAYVVATTTEPSDPADVASVIQEHDDFNFFGLDLSQVHDPNYDSYINAGSSTSAAPSSTSTVHSSSSISISSTSAAPSSTSTVHSSSSVPISSTSTASGPLQTQWGQTNVPVLVFATQNIPI
ncbi:hypothetical protein PHLCEN_2v5869 [Hermanssonia centrifuga]|uniref:Cellobiose dehydrogenase-like cytochrome domain-containing protein n=1 Tax=Hermanssonia centrifuga TaxID=98765 RepID=A0A2R6P145_9APHY|nr:hypothetical protein PHLCEN_2v5869 [Hermanssonia centrifuga]